MEWQSKNSSNSVFHWDLLKEANGDIMNIKSKEDILRAGQVSGGPLGTVV